MRLARLAVVVVGVSCGAPPTTPTNAAGAPTCVEVARILRGTVDGVDASRAKQAAIARTCESDRWAAAAIDCIAREHQVYVCRARLTDDQRTRYRTTLCAYQDKFPEESRDIDGCEKPASPLAKTDLYERLGGKDALGAIVDEWVVNIIADQRVAAYFKNANVVALKQQLGVLLCEVTSGPCKYTGKKMRVAHRGMAIKDTDYRAVVEGLVRALDHFRVNDREKTELLGILAQLEPQIVGQ